MKEPRDIERHAVIDVGTNSVKLLVADVGHTVKPLLKLSRHTRLGEGSFRSGRLQPEAMAQTVAAVAELASRAMQLRPVTLRVLATSAMREAVNREEVVLAIFQATGLSVEIISGGQEAAFLFWGVMAEPAIGSQLVLIVDVGGGSTEWVLGEGGSACFTASTKLGTSRLLEEFPPGDPPTPASLARCRRAVADLLAEAVRPRLQPVLAGFCGRPICLVGLGAACKSLARLVSGSSTEDTAPMRVRVEQVREQVERLWRLSAHARRNLSGLAPEKADVILAGSLIFEEIMSQFDFTELIRANHGLRSGVLLNSRNEAATTRARWHPVPVPCLTAMLNEARTPPNATGPPA